MEFTPSEFTNTIWREARDFARRQPRKMIMKILGSIDSALYGFFSAIWATHPDWGPDRFKRDYSYRLEKPGG
jgi:hypothetical protein